MSLRHLYRCTSEGKVNNGLKSSCAFEMEFDEGSHHCPLCGKELQRVTVGKTLSEVLREGQLKHDKKGTQK